MANEIIKQRDMYSKTFDEGEGKFRTEMFCTPVHYEKNDGSWDDIDVRVKNLKQWEFTNGVTDNIFKAYFGDKTDSENNHLFGIEYFKDSQSKWINFKLKDSTTKFSETYGENDNRFKFIECFENIDVEYVVSSDSLKENIILKEKSDRRIFEFTIKSGGVTIINDGNFKVVDLDNKFTIWNIDRPYMIDTNGNQSFGVTYTLDNDGEFDTLTVTVTDEEFISSASYPVVIDPSVVVADSINAISYASANFGAVNTSGFTADTIHIGQSAFGALHFKEIEKFRGKFNTHVFTKATISLYATSGRNDLVRTNRINANWGSGIAYPSNSGVAITSGVYATGGNWYSFDIKGALNDTFNGIYIFGDYNYHIYFASPRHTNASARPRLTLEYYVKPSLIFLDEIGDFYTSGDGETIFKYLQFDPMIAGQTSIAKRVYCRNYSGFDVENLQVYVNENELTTGMHVKLSKTNNPFIEEDLIYLDGILQDEEDRNFYVRISTDDDAQSGGDFNIYAKAKPVF